MVDDSSVNNEVFISADGSLKKTAMHWLFGQQANTVALYIIIAAIFYGGWYCVTTGIPAHLKQIHDGYKEVGKEAIDKIERIAKDNLDFHRELRTDHAKEMDKLQNVFEKAVDKYEKAFAEGFKSRSGAREQ